MSSLRFSEIPEIFKNSLSMHFILMSLFDAKKLQSKAFYEVFDQLILSANDIVSILSLWPQDIIKLWCYHFQMNQCNYAIHCKWLYVQIMILWWYWWLVVLNPMESYNLLYCLYITSFEERGQVSNDHNTCINTKYTCSRLIIVT